MTEQLQRYTSLKTLLPPNELESALRAVLEVRYHNLHPFHRLMNEGKLTKGQMQAWAINRYCYQSIIPKKDAIILSRADGVNAIDFRRKWRERIVDHDGTGNAPNNSGGLIRWLKLAEGVGVDEQTVLSRQKALPATRFAVNEYVNIVSNNSLLVAVASSLTEMSSGRAIKERVPAMLARYDYITPDTLSYFTPRLKQAPRDANFALNYVKENAITPDAQAMVIDALIAKCDILWAMLDALYHAYVDPGHIPPGAFIPDRPDK